jgi:transketolase
MTSGLDKEWFKNKKEYNFKGKYLSNSVLNKLKELSHMCRGDILKMTTIAGSGHPGGSLSSIDIYTLVYSLSDLSDNEVVISHGHTAPGVYSILGRLGIFDIEEVLTFFRYVNGPYEGHVESHLPGIVWSTGNLGQGLSAACGFAMAKKLKKEESKVFALMSDAEQAKGQVAEARRFASKFNLNNLTVVIDYNNRQISGKIEDIMPINIKEDYLADDWKVIEVCGHDFEELYSSLRMAVMDESAHYAIIGETEMCKGISFIEGNEEYHGRALTEEELGRALNELGIENDIPKYKKRREEKEPTQVKLNNNKIPVPELDIGKPIEYKIGEKIANRNAFGNALLDLSKRNKPGSIVVLDCDLASSVRTNKFEKELPEFFVQNGVSEHNTATVSGALSIRGFQTFLSDFGVFGVDEMYNQHRLNAINGTKLRLVVTHCGINVGEDGKTHQCIDYLGVLKNLLNFKVIIPADPNQTDRIIRYITKIDGNVAVIMGRAKDSVISDSNENPFFGGDYDYEYGKVDLIREGNNGVILSYGHALHYAIRIRDLLNNHGINIAVLNVSSPLAINSEDVLEICNYKNVFTYEEHIIYSGLGCILGNLIAKSSKSVNYHSFGIVDFAPSGSSEGLYKKIGLDPKMIAKKIAEVIS